MLRKCVWQISETVFQDPFLLGWPLHAQLLWRRRRYVVSSVTSGPVPLHEMPLCFLIASFSSQMCLKIFCNCFSGPVRSFFGFFWPCITVANASFFFSSQNLVYFPVNGIHPLRTLFIAYCCFAYTQMTKLFFNNNVLFLRMYLGLLLSISLWRRIMGHYCSGLVQYYDWKKELCIDQTIQECSWMQWSTQWEPQIWGSDENILK